MPLIPYPNVPKLPGVPALLRVGSSVAGGVALLKSVGLIRDWTRFWGIVDKDGKELITPDSVLAFEYRGEARIGTFPVEGGSFSSYNKIENPADARMTITIGGDGASARLSVLDKLESLKKGVDLVNILTPEQQYNSFSITGYDYRRESTKGVTLLTIDITFQEVRQTAIAEYSQTAKPAGADPVSNGSVGATPVPNGVTNSGVQ